MISKATSVAKYVNEVPAGRRAAIRKLRALCRENLGGYEERMEYGLPAYKRGGNMEIAFASQKNFIAFYVLKKQVMDEFRDEFAGAASIGKGCIRFSKPEKIDFEVLKKILRRTAESGSRPC